MDWGFAIKRARTIDISRNDMRFSEQLLSQFPELQSCIGCGGCTATCTAGALTPFNIRKLHTLVRRGEYKEAEEQINKCMLCGKCILVCPRGINTRRIILAIKDHISSR